MADERQITTDDVLAVAPTTGPSAERIAAYANLRAAGVVPPDASVQVGVCLSTGNRYERWTEAIRQHLGLAPLDRPRGFAPVSHERKVQAGQSGNHTRYHTLRGVTSPDCPLCAADEVGVS